jgi:hypothetical protein
MKIMLLRRMQVAIPLAGQSKPFSMSVLRKVPLCLKPSHCAILGRFARIRTASVVQTAGHFSLFGRQVFARGFGKALQALCPSGLHALEIRGGLDRLLNDARLQLLFRLAALLGKDHGGQHFKERITIFVQRRA